MCDPGKCRARLAAVGALATALVGGSAPSAEATVLVGGPERVSIGSDGQQARNYSFGGEVSSDGRFVAFTSKANNLVPGDSGRLDVFVRDRELGTTTRVSVSSTERPANRPSWVEDLSGDGRYVVFSSVATNLVPHDTNRKSDVFLRDTLRGTTHRISKAGNGRKGNDASWDGQISGNGKWVAFTSVATNLVPGATTPDRAHVYLRRLGTQRTILVSRNSNGSPASGWSSGPALSASGRFVSFQSNARNLGPGSDARHEKVFLRDRRTGETRLVSLRPDGRPFPFDSGFADISADGRVVAWVTGFFDRAGPFYTTYAWDRRTGVSELVSRKSSGSASPGMSVASVSVSATGRLILFGSYDNLTEDEPGNVGLFEGDADVFIRHRVEGTTTRVSRPASDPEDFAPGSWAGEMTANGQWVTFTSSDDTLVDNDTNGDDDVFIQRLASSD